MSRSVWAVVQARTGSTRLPRKVLADIEGKAMLDRVVERVTSADTIDGVIVATTHQPTDDAIIDLLTSHCHVQVVRGAESDVLDRYRDAQRACGADVIVRITSDCPLIDPGLIDDVVGALEEGIDYASNTLEPRTYPRGLDVEAMTSEALEEAWRRDDDPAWREHVTPYLYRNPGRFTLRRVSHGRDLSHHRWTVDTPEDLELVRRIYRHLDEGAFGWREVLQVLETHPEWSDLNRHIEQKQVG